MNLCRYKYAYLANIHCVKLMRYSLKFPYIDNIYIEMFVAISFEKV